MAKATEAQLSDLHGRIAKVMVNTLDNVEKAQIIYENLDPETIADKGFKHPEVSAPMLAVMAKFLVDNKITVAIEDSAEMSTLQKRLDNKKEAREKRLENVSFISDYRDAG